jgi:hypothetical protein
VTESRHALLIASSVYDDPQLYDLAGSHNDAALLARVLKDSKIGRFKVKRVTNPTSSRAALAVEEFFSDRTYEDLLLLFFSGHGLKSDDGELYLATRNTRRRTLRSTSLSSSFVSDVMQTSGSQRQVLLLDCCYGGAFARALAKGDPHVDVIERLEGFGIAALSASNELEFAWEEDGIDQVPRKSVFTSVLTKGLSTGAADLDRDGQITVDELFRYVSKEVRAGGKSQTPTMSSLGREGDLILGTAPRRAQRPMRATRKIQEIDPEVDPGIDMSPYIMIRDYRRGDGSPAAIAVASAVEASMASQGVRVTLSARSLTNKARDFSGEHVTISSTVSTALKYGIPIEGAWPAGEDVGVWSGNSWDRIDQKRPRLYPHVGIGQNYKFIAHALHRGQPVILGVNLHEDAWWQDEIMANNGWITLSRNAKVSAVHPIVFVSYESGTDSLKFANSLGISWGDQGFGQVAVEDVENFLTKRAALEGEDGSSLDFIAFTAAVMLMRKETAERLGK